jgi:ribosomal protein S18 acetylase RimI-like enzyme
MLANDHAIDDAGAVGAGHLQFRRARAADSDQIAAVVFGDVDQETRRVTAALYGISDAERMRPLFELLWRDAGNWRSTLVAERDGEIVGVLQLGPSNIKITAGAVGVAFRVFGWRALRLPSRLRLHDRVAPAKPDDALVISELHVKSSERGRGVGRELLGRAEAVARVAAYPSIALHTYTSNPARSLYERSGYVATQYATDPRFEKLTGTAGNVLYVKQLDP